MSKILFLDRDGVLRLTDDLRPGHRGRARGVSGFVILRIKVVTTEPPGDSFKVTFK